jgi:hypothetical protein
MTKINLHSLHTTNCQFRVSYARFYFYANVNLLTIKILHFIFQ